MTNFFFNIIDFIRVYTQGGWKIMSSPSTDILDAIVKYHFIPLNNIRKNIPFALRVTSCYRSKDHEYDRGRSGTSQHCFDKSSTYSEKYGATDVEAWNEGEVSSDDMVRLFEEICKSPYNRIAYYPGSAFFHLDYKLEGRHYYIQDVNGWKISSKTAIIEKIREDFR